MPLKLIKKEELSALTISSKSPSRIEREAHFERRWRLFPAQFDPLLSAYGRLRINRTFELLLNHVSLPQSHCVELGCGWGRLSQKCAEHGAQVLAVDIAEGALKYLRNYPGIICEKHFMPYTMLSDSCFDIVIAADLIACLPETDYRLFFSELTRIVKKEGKVMVSTPFDIHSEETFERFIHLAQTELSILHIRKGYHLLWERIRHFISSSAWRRFIFKPLQNFFIDNDFLLKKLECITEFFYGDSGVTHVIVIAKPRSLYPEEMPERS